MSKSVFIKPIVLLLFVVCIILASSSLTFAANEQEVYQNAVSEYNQAVQQLNEINSKYPNWEISGEIIFREDSYIMIWGNANNNWASDNHEGWVVGGGNIKILNPNADGITKGKYYASSGHYYIKQESGVGLFGQKVPVKVYAAVPVSVQKEINNCKARIARAEDAIKEARRNLPPDFSIGYSKNNSIVTDNIENHIEIDEFPCRVKLSSTSVAAETLEWYIWDNNSANWTFVSDKVSFEYEILKEGETQFKLVKNGNQDSYIVHSVWVDKPIKLVVNKKRLFLDAKPVIIEGSLLVPVRAIFESLGANVRWDEKTNTVTGTTDSIKIELKLNSKEAIVNGKAKTLDVAATKVQGSVFVPARFISENFGAKVEWDGNAKVVSVTESSIERWLYLLNGVDRKLYKIKADGTERFDITDDKVADFKVVGNWIYYTTANKKNLYKVQVNGTGKVRLIDEKIEFFDIMGEDIFYKLDDSFNHKMHTIKTDGSGKKVMEDIYPDYLIAYDGWIYYINEFEVIWRMKPDGSQNTRISPKTTGGFIISNGVIYYWATDTHDGLFSVKIDGSEPKVLSEDQVSSVNVVGNWVYFYSAEDDKTHYMQIDGTSEKTFVDKHRVQKAVDLNGYVYFVGRDDAFSRERLYKVKAGSQNLLALNGIAADDLLIDSNWIFYIGANGFYRVKTNGSENSVFTITHDYVVKAELVK